MVNPVALSLFPEVGFLPLHLLDHHDREVVCRVAQGVEMGSYWFLEPLADVTAVSIEVDMERVLCLPHVLQFAYPALDEVDNVSHLAGCCCSNVVGSADGSAHESVLGPDLLQVHHIEDDSMDFFLGLGNCQAAFFSGGLRESS